MSNVVNSIVFQKQVNKLLKKYINLEKDLKILDSNFEFESFSDLWKWFRKYRIKNSSIPTWKRWGFRLIVKELHWNIIPISIYSKTSRENITISEIEKNYLIILNELKQWQKK